MHGQGFPSGTYGGTGWAGKASAVYMARLYVTLHKVSAGEGEATLEAMPVADCGDRHGGTFHYQITSITWRATRPANSCLGSCGRRTAGRPDTDLTFGKQRANKRSTVPHRSAAAPAASSTTTCC